MTPQQQVFVIPELATAVCKFLPTADLLFAQRINRTLRFVITASPLLQKLLFLDPEVVPNRVFEASANGTLDDSSEFHGHKTEINPLLQKVFPAWFLEWHATRSIMKS